jgi:uncharacterized protein YcfL
MVGKQLQFISQACLIMNNFAINLLLQNTSDNCYWKSMNLSIKATNYKTIVFSNYMIQQDTLTRTQKTLKKNELSIYETLNMDYQSYAYDKLTVHYKPQLEHWAITCDTTVHVIQDQTTNVIKFVMMM